MDDAKGAPKQYFSVDRNCEKCYGRGVMGRDVTKDTLLGCKCLRLERKYPVVDVPRSRQLLIYTGGVFHKVLDNGEGRA